MTHSKWVNGIIFRIRTVYYYGICRPASGQRNGCPVFLRFLLAPDGGKNDIYIYFISK